MKKLILRMGVSLDGFMAGPNNNLDWMFPFMGSEGKQWLAERLSRGGAHLMGSHTYADMAAYWPKSNDVLAPCMNEIPKIVFSRKAPSALLGGTTQALKDASAAIPIDPTIAKSWTEPRVVSGDLAQEIERLKAEPGKDLIAHGGVAFARSLAASGLVDEYWLLVSPIAIGRGQGLFSELSQPQPFDLVSSTSFPTGVCAQILRPKRA